MPRRGVCALRVLVALGGQGDEEADPRLSGEWHGELRRAGPQRPEHQRGRGPFWKGHCGPGVALWEPRRAAAGRGCRGGRTRAGLASAGLSQGPRGASERPRGLKASGRGDAGAGGGRTSSGL